MRSMPEGVRSMEGLGRRLLMARKTKSELDCTKDGGNLKALLRIDSNQRRYANRPEQGLPFELGK